MKKRILIAGYYGYGNAGDELILAAILRGFRLQDPAFDFFVLSGDPAEIHSRYNVDSIAWSDFPGMIRAIRTSDLCILGGGGLLQDYWGINDEHLLMPQVTGLGTYLNVPLLANLFGKPVVFHAIGVGPLFSKTAIDLVRLSASLCDEISLRDNRSRIELETILASVPNMNPKISVTADPVFLYEPTGMISKNVESIRQRLDLERPVLGVSLRYWDFGAHPDKYTWEIAKALDQYVHDKNADILFIPFQAQATFSYGNDIEIHKLVKHKMAEQDHLHLVESELEPYEIPQLIQLCDSYLGMRYHALLLALISSKPAVGLAYDPKVDALFEEADHPQLSLSMSHWRSSDIYSLLIASPDEFSRKKMEGFVERKRDLAMQDFSRVSRITSRESCGSEVSPDVVEKLLQKIYSTSQRLTSSEKEILRYQAIEQERDYYATNFDMLQQELAGIRGTRGYRLLTAHWRVSNYLFPPGSKRRQYAKRLLHSLGLYKGSPAIHLRSTGLDTFDSQSANIVALEDWNAVINDHNPEKIAVILSATAWENTSGQRSMNLAREWAHQKLAVLYCYWRWDRGEWDYLPSFEKGVVPIPLDIFTNYPSQFVSNYPDIEKILIMEFPHPEFFASLALTGSDGWITIYDIIDDWQDFHRVGQAEWYDPDFETHLINVVDFVVATNKVLAEKAKGLGALEVMIVPNGYRPGIDDVQMQVELRRGDLTLGYFGNLTTAWFDWNLVLEIAERKPEWTIHLVGQAARTDIPTLPDNIYFHSVKPQGELAAYAKNWDIGIIPFKDILLARAADTIKAYEYTAMRLPVVMQGSHPPVGSEGWMKRTDTVDEFISAAEQLSDVDLWNTEVDIFLAQSTWALRAHRLLSAIEEGEQRIAWKRALFS